MNKAEKLFNKKKYQVFLMSCPANLPFSFASHNFFVLNEKGKLTRWEAGVWNKRDANNWGHLHRNLYPTFGGIRIFAFVGPAWLWKARVLKVVDGELAERMIQSINNTPKTYPYCYKYHYTGINSNSYIQWIMDQFPEFNKKLPWNAIGKKYKQL